MSPLSQLERALTVTEPAGAISEALKVAGVTKQKDQADIVGELPQHWNRYLQGHRSPKCSKVAEWLQHAKAKGHAITLTWTAEGACVSL